MTDQSDAIAEAVLTARQNGDSLYVMGGDSKRELLGRTCKSRPLDVSGHQGIVDYQPSELVISARAGTPISKIRDTLAAEQQEMGFEPPMFNGRATLGGTLACNLSGPSRPWRGSIRDVTLGIKLVNGDGQKLSFGGQVMKNVAGYDVSRLQAGAMGTLGVITEVSLKVLPRLEENRTLAYETGAEDAILLMNRRAGEPRPLSGAMWVDGRLFLRISGTAEAVRQTIRVWGGEEVHPEATPWAALTEMELPFFNASPVLWRLSLASGAPVELPADRMLIDWGGSVRWLRGEADFSELQDAAAAAGGHACLYRGGDRNGEVRQSLTAVEQRLQQRLKNAFDPARTLNPGRLYSWM